MMAEFTLEDLLEDPYTEEKSLNQMYFLDTPPETPVVVPVVQENHIQYSTYAALISRMNEILWVESPKLNPIRQLTPMTFWFIICAQYFPREYSLEKAMQSLFQEVNFTEENYSIQDEMLILELRKIVKITITRFQEQGCNDIDSLIIHLEAEQKALKEEALQQLNINVESTNIETTEDLLRDLVGLTQVEQEYLAYLENQQQDHRQKEFKSKTLNLSGTARMLTNGIKALCSICNEATKEEDTQSCIKCNITVHKKCYGTEFVQSICNLCIAFGQKARFVRCPLCTQRGGAMQDTGILMRDSIFENNNPAYHSYALGYKLEKQSIFNVIVEILPESEPCFYDCNWIHYQNEVQEVKAEKIWCHLTCLNLLDELSEIDKKKFNLVCSICKAKKQGACLTCEDSTCPIAFHPECARRAQILIDSKIYCYKHQPLKLKRILENKHNQWTEEIIAFFKTIEKLEQWVNTRPMPKFKTNRNQQLKSQELKQQQQSIEADIKQENENLMKKIEQLFQLRIIIQNNQVVSVYTPPDISIYEIPPEDPIWTEFPDYTPDQIYILYQRAVRMRKKVKKVPAQVEELPVRNRKSLYSKPKLLKKIKKNKLRIKIPKEEMSQVYCVCQQAFKDGDEMMQCESCKEWYHLKCLGFTQTIQQAQLIQFYCFRCESKLNREESRISKKSAHLFADPTFRSLKMKAHDLRTVEKKNYRNLTK